MITIDHSNEKYDENKYIKKKEKRIRSKNIPIEGTTQLTNEKKEKNENTDFEYSSEMSSFDDKIQDSGQEIRKPKLLMRFQKLNLNFIMIQLKCMLTI